MGLYDKPSSRYPEPDQRNFPSFYQEVFMTSTTQLQKCASLLALGVWLASCGAPALAQTSWSSSPQATASDPATQNAGNIYSTQLGQAICTDCGQVTAVSVAEKPGDSNAVGVIAGGVAGAVLGHQVGGGFGKDLATLAGAVGGAFAGKKIQENMNTTKVWTVAVKYPNGNTTNFLISNNVQPSSRGEPVGA
jgi:outer membrane lipoprotein SlyB